MKKIKKLTILITLIFILTFPITVKAQDEVEEEFDFTGINELLQSVTSEANKTPDINSRHAVVYDRATGKTLYGKKENEKCKMASTTKIMTSIIVVENQQNIKAKTKISAKSAGTGGSRLGLKKDDEITIEDLLYGLMLCSGNDAAVALAEHISGSVPEFAKLMNQKAEELGLKNTHFVTPHGLDEEEHYTTAYELAQIADYALKNPQIAKIVRTTNHTVMINKSPKELKNTNELLGNLNGVYGVKTGFTNGANRCLVTSVKRENMDIIAVVLGADTKKDRTKDSIKIIEYTFANYKMVDLKYMLEEEFDKLVQTESFKIIKGKHSNLGMELEEPNINLYPVKKEEVKDIEIKTDLQTTLNAPISAGEPLGTIKITLKGIDICTLKITARNEIKKKSAIDYFLELIPKYFSNNLKNCF